MHTEVEMGGLEDLEAGQEETQEMADAEEGVAEEILQVPEELEFRVGMAGLTLTARLVAELEGRLE